MLWSEVFLSMPQNVKILSRAPALAPQALYFGYNVMSLLQSTHTILKFLSILGYEPSNRHWLDKSTSLKNRKWMSAWSQNWFLSKWNCTWYYERQVNRRHSSFLFIADIQVQIICSTYLKQYKFGTNMTYLFWCFHFPATTSTDAVLWAAFVFILANRKRKLNYNITV